ncbi:RICIN domain-containing protein [Streptomyces sp. NBC_00239]|uniref:RICIN domain-containing protein n=1 Tax=Streptomyces sp. NBC_00239 TaxID=2903640 RepID=UPI002E28C37B|nr:RICIN domain-containing protein [Streptomyces sp. NBC_00239]
MTGVFMRRVGLAAAISGAVLGNLLWASGPAGAAVEAKATYLRLESVSSGKCLNVTGASWDNGAQVIQWDCGDTPNNNWSFEKLPSGWYQIRAQHSGKCLDVEGAVWGNGAPVIQWDCKKSTNQSWKIINRAEDGSYMLQARHSGRCLNVEGASQDNLARIIQWDCVDTTNNRWFQEEAN